MVGIGTPLRLTYGHGDHWMNLPFSLRSVMIALMAAGAIALGSGGASAQAPSNGEGAGASPAATASPAASASPAPTPSASPTPAASPSASPSPSAEQSPAAPPSVQTADPFGEETTLPARKVVIVKGTATWDSAFDTLIDSVKALKFVHRGSYDNMDNTYEAITNHLEEKKIETKDIFIEEYITDPLKTAEDKLVINVYVPLK